jgi:hypothetical protein
VQVMGLPAAAVGIWADHATSPCALLQDGSVWCWGVTGHWIAYQPPPMVDSAPAPPNRLLRAGPGADDGGRMGYVLRPADDRGGAMLGTGGASPWGWYASFDGGAEYSAQPVNVLPAGSGGVEIRSGDTDACVLLADGGVTCWGTLGVPTKTPGL